jgi:hypothetical protein
MRKPKDWGQPCPNPDCSPYRLIHRDVFSVIALYGFLALLMIRMVLLRLQESPISIGVDS